MGAASAINPIHRTVREWERRAGRRNRRLMRRETSRLFRALGSVDMTSRTLRIFCADHRDLALQGANRAGYDLAEVGTVYHLPGIGVTSTAPDGATGTGHLTTGKTCAQLGMGLNDHGILLVQSTDTTSLAGAAGALGGGPQIALKPRNQFLISFFSSRGTVVSFSNSKGAGVTAFSRTSSSVGWYGCGSATNDWGDITDGVLPTGTFFYLRQGASASYHPGTFPAAIEGRGFSKAEYPIVEAALKSFCDRVGIVFEETETEIVIGPNTFTRTDNATLVASGIRPTMTSAPPKNDSVQHDTYPYWPATHFLTRPWSYALSSATKYAPVTATSGITGSTLLWIDAVSPRNNDVMSPFLVGPKSARTILPTMLAAELSTLSKAMHDLRRPFRAPVSARDPFGGILDMIDARQAHLPDDEKPLPTAPWAPYVAAYDAAVLSGDSAAIAAAEFNLYGDANIDTLDPVTMRGLAHHAFCKANKDTLFVIPGAGGRACAENLVVLTLRTSGDQLSILGHCADLEVSDNRTPAQLLAHMQDICTLHHAENQARVAAGTHNGIDFGFAIDTHNLTSGSARKSGWDVSMGAALYATPGLRWIALTVDSSHSGTAAEIIEDQLAVLGLTPSSPDLSRVCVKIIAGNLGLGVAADAGAWARSRGIQNCMVVRGGLSQGGDCSNHFNKVVEAFYQLGRCP